MSISKEQLEQRKDEQPIFTDEQKKRMTSVIFKDDAVLSQLQQAQKDRNTGISTYSNSEEEFAQVLQRNR
ncbi:hypothetical protein QW71_23285 [Paenibacillus sp. IHB B 3415]|uniref:hypothetical protein n=1 Tax=Paenibacillus sp. IHB B 3415 TaxID=867080 RepID=UPI0005743F7E|nr:hypothetical protein [Paenibacillus sp. IHB B 3415]KHL93453.1 hypothetical protein QW71_23285 [Paenibacillus sp. IHB B 3415]